MFDVYARLSRESAVRLADFILTEYPFSVCYLTVSHDSLQAGIRTGEPVGEFKDRLLKVIKRGESLMVSHSIMEEEAIENRVIVHVIGVIKSSKYGLLESIENKRREHRMININEYPSFYLVGEVDKLEALEEIKRDFSFNSKEIRSEVKVGRKSSDEHTGFVEIKMHAVNLDKLIERLKICEKLEAKYAMTPAGDDEGDIVSIKIHGTEGLFSIVNLLDLMVDKTFFISYKP